MWCGMGHIWGEIGNWSMWGCGVNQTIQMVLDINMQNNVSVTEHKTSCIWQQELHSRLIPTHWSGALNYQLYSLRGISGPATQVPRWMSLHFTPSVYYLHHIQYQKQIILLVPNPLYLDYYAFQGVSHVLQKTISWERRGNGEQETVLARELTSIVTN